MYKLLHIPTGRYWAVVSNKSYDDLETMFMAFKCSTITMFRGNMFLFHDIGSCATASCVRVTKEQFEIVEVKNV